MYNRYIKYLHISTWDSLKNLGGWVYIIIIIQINKLVLVKNKQNTL